MNSSPKLYISIPGGPQLAQPTVLAVYERRLTGAGQEEILDKSSGRSNWEPRPHPEREPNGYRQDLYW